MAHEIRDNDVFAGVGVQSTKRAWHGLGDEIPDGLSAVEAFEQVGLGWETELAPIHAKREDGGIIVLDKHFAHLRKDTGDVLGMVTDGYKPFENMDLARMADALAGEQKKVVTETCGSLYGGRRIYALVKLPKTIEVTRSDVLQQYILVSNGHGGFAMLSAYPTSIRVVCANTLRWSERDVARGGRWRHSGDFESKVKQAKALMGLATQENEIFEEKVRLLVRTNMTVKRVKTYMDRIYDKCFGKIDELGDAETVEKLKAKKKAVLEKWFENLENERQTLPGIKGTAWATYNAVSEWHDHQRGRYNTVHESGARVHSNLYGVAQKHKLRAFNEALALAK